MDFEKIAKLYDAPTSDELIKDILDYCFARSKIYLPVDSKADESFVTMMLCSLTVTTNLICTFYMVNEIEIKDRQKFEGAFVNLFRRALKDGLEFKENEG
jgi:hypothetical protein